MIIKRLSVCTLLAAITLPSLAALENAVDSVWYDSITGTRTHLQKVDSLSPYTCSLHFFGKKADGAPKSPALQALVEDIGINALVLGWDRYVQDRSWAYVTGDVIHRNLKDGWVWDNDSFSGNQFSHPYHGGMFYNAAREHGLSYGVSLLYPILGSCTWELFCETNKPAVNDFLSTGIGGAAIGEVTHRTSDIFFDNSKRGASRVAREIIGTFLNPVRGLHRIMSGEMFRVDHLNRGKREEAEPYTFQVGVGNRFIRDLGHVHPAIGHRYSENVPYLDVRFSYGNHYNNLDKGVATRAFDYFDLYALVNLDSDNPTVGELDISGRIGSIQRQLPHRWKLDIGFYQNIKYIDHYSDNGNQTAGNQAVISEAASFGAGFHAERQGTSVSLLQDLMISAVPLGGSTADYYSAMRRYNFGTGFSARYKFNFIYNRHLSFGDEAYFMRLFIIKGTTPEKLDKYVNNKDQYYDLFADGINSWGDEGQQSIFLNRLFLNVNLTRTLSLNLMHEYYMRHGNYRYYPSYTGKCNEWKAGIKYAL